MVKIISKLFRCIFGVKKKESFTDKIEEIKSLLAQGMLDKCSMLITEELPNIKNIRYASFAASVVLPEFEKEFPENKDARNAIIAADTYIAKQTDDNRIEATMAHSKAYDTDQPACEAAAYAAMCASDKKFEYVSRYSYDAYSHAAEAATDKIKTKTDIINFGISLLENQED